MSNNNRKKLYVEVSEECLKTIKKIAIDKDTNASHVASDMLERIMSKKGNKQEEVS